MYTRTSPRRNDCSLWEDRLRNSTPRPVECSHTSRPPQRVLAQSRIHEYRSWRVRCCRILLKNLRVHISMELPSASGPSLSSRAQDAHTDRQSSSSATSPAPTTVPTLKKGRARGPCSHKDDLEDRVEDEESIDASSAAAAEGGSKGKNSAEGVEEAEELGEDMSCCLRRRLPSRPTPSPPFAREGDIFCTWPPFLSRLERDWAVLTVGFTQNRSSGGMGLAHSLAWEWEAPISR